MIGMAAQISSGFAGISGKKPTWFDDITLLPRYPPPRGLRKQ